MPERHEHADLAAGGPRTVAALRRDRAEPTASRITRTSTPRRALGEGFDDGAARGVVAEDEHRQVDGPLGGAR